MKKFRPFAISPIKNNLLRRSAMLVMFFPILLIGLVYSTVTHVKSLCESMIEYWSAPRIVDDGVFEEVYVLASSEKQFVFYARDMSANFNNSSGSQKPYRFTRIRSENDMNSIEYGFRYVYIGGNGMPNGLLMKNAVRLDPHSLEKITNFKSP